MWSRRRSVMVLAMGSVLSVAACAASSTPAPSATPAPVATTTGVHIIISSIAFTSDGWKAAATSPVMGDGSVAGDLVVDDSDPGPEGNCNTVDERGTFSFSAGSISYRSWHRDCNFTGPRIQTEFAITGGTGEFAGATGYGTERDDAPEGFVYDGTITYLTTAPTPSAGVTVSFAPS